MKAIKLTPKERELFEDLKATNGGMLREHIKMTNTICFRLLDIKLNPLKNYRFGLIHQLVEKGVLELNVNKDYVLRATIDEPDKYKNVGLVKGGTY